MLRLLRNSFLNLLSLPYRAFNYSRRYIVKGRKAPLPVISVGSLSYGGSGKTPVAAAIANFLLRQGVAVALGLRGYRSAAENFNFYFPPGRELDPTLAGDEAAVLRELVPEAGIFVGKRREVSAEAAESLGYRVLVLDDAFQYLSLRKDLNVVIYTSEPPFYRRELEAALRFAHIVLVREGEKPPMGPFKVFRLRFRIGLNEFKGEKVFAFFGIARPDRLLSLLEGLALSGWMVFKDHHSYTHKDLEEIYKRAGDSLILTTLKDYVKVKRLEGFDPERIKWIKWEAQILEPEFYQLLRSFA